MKKRIIFAASLFFQSVYGQVLPLDSILFTIEKNNPELKVYDAQISALNEYAKGARALDPPQVGAGFFMTPYNPSMWGADEMNGYEGMGSFMISAQQMFMNRQKRDANAKYMGSMQSVDSAMKKSMRNEIFAMGKMNYYEYVILQKKLNVLRQSEELINYLIKSTELRYTYGMDKLNAYYKAKAMLAEVQSMQIMSSQEANEKIVLLNTLMNRDKNFQFQPDTTIVIKQYETMKIDSFSITKSRSDYAALSKEINLLQNKANYELSKRNPDFGVRFDHMFPFGIQPQQFSLMLMVTIPLAPWSSKMYSATAKGLVIEKEVVNEKQRSLINQVQGKIEIYQIQISAKKKQLALTQNVLIPAMKKNYETELLAYEQNTKMLFMVLDAWQNLKMAQLTYFDQLMDIINLQVKFERELEIK
jgi:outer membrane protein TolC